MRENFSRRLLNMANTVHVQQHKKRKKRKPGLIARWVINFIAIVITAQLIRGLQFDGLQSMVLSAGILSVVNTVIRPILMILSFPFTILTLGLFTFVINALMLLLTAQVMPGFTIAGFWSAFFGAILISIFSSSISSLRD
jgi:putative membrane protein